MYGGHVYRQAPKGLRDRNRSMLIFFLGQIEQCVAPGTSCTLAQNHGLVSEVVLSLTTARVDEQAGIRKQENICVCCDRLRKTRSLLSQDAEATTLIVRCQQHRFLKEQLSAARYGRPPQMETSTIEYLRHEDFESWKSYDHMDRMVAYAASDRLSWSSCGVFP